MEKTTIKMNCFSTKWSLIILVLGPVIFFTAKAQEGETLFKENCAVCHQLGSRLIGPDLTGVTEKRSEDWLIQFISSSQSMIKSGDKDAVAVFEEFNQMLMPDQSHLDNEQIKSILTYIKKYSENAVARESETATTQEASSSQVQEVVEYTEQEVTLGKELFTGQKPLENGGPSCITCHNVTHDEIISGGLLARDLTTVYGRLGDAGVKGIVASPPFPAMAQSYRSAPLTDSEITQLAAFFSEMNEASDERAVKSGNNVFIFGSTSGLIGLLVIIGLLWRKRKKKSVKHGIFRRQIKSI